MKHQGDKLVGLVEMFDYKKRTNTITIGYRLNETYWHQGIATASCGLVVKYLTGTIGIHTLMAYVMPENIYSVKVLLANGFAKEDYTKEEYYWGGREKVCVDVYRYSVE